MTMHLPAAHEQTYLGDGAYARSRGYDIELYTSNGVTETDHVFLGPTELTALLAWLGAP